MPEKDGAEEKSTKSVVNKKQKQMMGEEGYDHLRDMGRIRKNKKKKDATTMPPSKEMEKTRKVNKGPSALDIVKKKYKGQIMKMEELDLTKVAEAFGGYIVEQDDSEAYKKELEKMYSRSRDLTKVDPPSDPKTGEKILRKIEILKRRKNKTRQPELFDTSKTGKEDPVKNVETTKDVIGSKKKQGRPFGSTNKSKETNPNKQLELSFDQKPKTKQLPPPEKITTKIKSGKVTGDVENPQGPKKPIRDRNRVLQKVRVAARSTKRPVQRLAKPLGKLAARNPFAAAIVGTDLLDRAGRAIPKPSLPKMDVGVVGRRTAG